MSHTIPLARIWNSVSCDTKSKLSSASLCGMRTSFTTFSFVLTDASFLGNSCGILLSYFSKLGSKFDEIVIVGITKQWTSGSRAVPFSVLLINRPSSLLWTSLYLPKASSIAVNITGSSTTLDTSCFWNSSDFIKVLHNRRLQN